MPFHGDGPENKGERSAIDCRIAIRHEQYRLHQSRKAKILRVESYAQTQEKQEQGIGSEQPVSIETQIVQLLLQRAYSENETAQQEK